MNPASELSHRELQNLVQKIQDIIYPPELKGERQAVEDSHDAANRDLDAFDAIEDAVERAHGVVAVSSPRIM